MVNLPDSSVLEAPEWMQQSLAKPLRWSLKTLGYLSQPLLGLTKSILTSPLIFYPLFRLIRSASIIRLWAKQAYATPTAITDEVLEVFSSPAYDRGAVKALRAMIHPKTKAEINSTAKVILPKLKIPMLLLWGQKDKMVPPKLGPLFTKYNPNLKLVEIENAGHCLHDEHPEIVNRVVLDWLISWQVEGESGVGNRESGVGQEL
jgi:pimeloyl-ACP methyl ester carboxylesterase